jgi:hypothetical protein
MRPDYGQLERGRAWFVAVADRCHEPGSFGLGDDLPDEQGEQDENEAGSKRLEGAPDRASIRGRRNTALVARGVARLRRLQLIVSRLLGSSNSYEAIVDAGVLATGRE